MKWSLSSFIAGVVATILALVLLGIAAARSAPIVVYGIVEDLTGIKEGEPVYLGGKEVGTVIATTLHSPKRSLVTLSIRRAEITGADGSLLLYQDGKLVLKSKAGASGAKELSFEPGALLGYPVLDGQVLWSSPGTLPGPTKPPCSWRHPSNCL